MDFYSIAAQEQCPCARPAWGKAFVGGFRSHLCELAALLLAYAKGASVGVRSSEGGYGARLFGFGTRLL